MRAKAGVASSPAACDDVAGLAVRQEASSAIDRIIPAALLAAAETRLRARVLVVASLSLALLGLIILIVRAASMPPDRGLVIVSVTVTVLLSLPLVQRWTGSLRLPAALIVALLVVTMPTYVILLGVFPAPALLVYPVVPVVATFFLGRGFGMATALLLASATLLLGTTLPAPGAEMMATMSRTFIVTSAAGTLMCASLAWTYERERARSEEELRAVNQALAEAQARAEAASRGKTEFLRHMSHELRTPLNSIIGYGELLEEELAEAGQDGMAADVVKIRSASRHLLSLINDLLDISRIEAGSVDLQYAEVDVAATISGVADAVTPLAAERGNTVRLAIARGLPPVRTDARRLQQVLLNLAGNACKFTDRGEVTIGAAVDPQSPDGVHVWVQDTGIGMTPEQLARIFEPFVQVDTSVERRSKGSGLGLSITRRLVELLGGEIAVTSEPGRGSEFRVRLPVRQANA